MQQEINQPIIIDSAKESSSDTDDDCTSSKHTIHSTIRHPPHLLPIEDEYSTDSDDDVVSFEDFPKAIKQSIQTDLARKENQLSRNDIVFQLSFSHNSLRKHDFFDCDIIKYQHFMGLRRNGGFVEDNVVDAYFGLLEKRNQNNQENFFVTCDWKNSILCIDEASREADLNKLNVDNVADRYNERLFSIKEYSFLSILKIHIGA